MLIVCPSCASSYNTPDAKLGSGGRTVRCKRCATTWFVRPPEPIDPFAAAMNSIEEAADGAGEIAARTAAVLQAEPAWRAAEPAATVPGSFGDEAQPSTDAGAPAAQDLAVQELAIQELVIHEPAVEAPAVQALARLDDSADDLPPRADLDGEVVATSARAEAAPAAAAATAAPASRLARLLALPAAAIALVRGRSAQGAAAASTPGSPQGDEAVHSAERLIPSRRANVFRPQEPESGGWMNTIAPYAAFAALCLAVLAVAARGPIAAASPAMARIYAAVGLGLSASPVAIVNVASELAPGEAGDVLLVEGEIVSRAAGQVQIPPLKVVVRDEKGVELYAWPAQSLKLALEPGERTVFRARLASPPPAGRTVQVRFEAAAPGDARRPRTS